MKTGMNHIAAIVLNYNSNEDLFRCVKLLKNQRGICLSIIVVDNCSNRDSKDELEDWIKKENEIYFISNNENKGYSAGNNIGLKLATKIGAKASLIVNPDMIIENINYIQILSDEMFLTENCAICSSRIKTLEGNDQNPLRESTFFEELFWIRSLVKPISYILPIKETRSIEVPKVSGCCLLINNKFLQKINYLDENVFLYCEEPILSAQVKKEGYKIIYIPTIEAIHAHIKSEKGNGSKRMLEMIKSRKYYLRKYSDYPLNKIILLEISYKILESIYKMKIWRQNGENT